MKLSHRLFKGWKVSVVGFVFLGLCYFRAQGDILLAVLFSLDGADYLVIGILFEVWLRRRSLLSKQIPRWPERS